MRQASVVPITAMTLLLGLAVPASTAAAAGPSAQIASLTGTGQAANNFSSSPASSANGTVVAFVSSASNLVPGDTNALDDVFVRTAGTTERISISSGGTEANGNSYEPAVSANGRYVAFRSDADTLAAGDASSAEDIFVRDRLTRRTERVSIASDERGAGEYAVSSSPTISADGRFVAFSSYSTALVARDANGAAADIFLRDRTAGTTERVSVSGAEVQGDDQSFAPALSPDGRYLTFESSSANLVAGDNNGNTDVFVRDRTRGTTERVSLGDRSQQGNDFSSGAAISADGRYVTWFSEATNLVRSDTNRAADIFVRDRTRKTTARVSMSSTGRQANGRSLFPDISADGRYVVFESLASTLTTDTNGRSDVFMHDRALGTTTRTSVGAGGRQGNEDSFATTISGNGGAITFASEASNLARDTNGWADVFVRAR